MAKRILLVNDHIHFGGGGDAVFRLERRFLEAQGFDVYTFSHVTSRPEDATEKDFTHLEDRSWALRHAKSSWLSRSGIRLPMCPADDQATRCTSSSRVVNTR